ncbi:Low-density lipoprotein particle receptor binding [Mactra antiquata]
MVTCIIFITALMFGNLYHFTSSEEFGSFQMAKVNMVWEKAQRNLEGKILSDVYADLLIQDKKEKDLKKRKLDGTDKDGLFEAEVRQNFLNILENYGLEHSARQEKQNLKKMGLSGKPGIDIQDMRLKKLLKEARKEGFTDSELQVLKEEMSHYQMKLNEYNSLKNDFERLDDKVDNSLEQDDVWKELSQKKKEMKQKYKEFTSGVERLQYKITDRENVAGKFEDPRVYHLWALAQKSGMSETELDNYRKELTHFENRIKKAEFIEDQLKRKEQMVRDGAAVDKDDHNQLRNHHERIVKKNDKYHTELKHKVHRKLDEL